MNGPKPPRRTLRSPRHAPSVSAALARRARPMASPVEPVTATGLEPQVTAAARDLMTGVVDLILSGGTGRLERQGSLTLEALGQGRRLDYELSVRVATLDTVDGDARPAAPVVAVDLSEDEPGTGEPAGPDPHGKRDGS